MRTFLSLTLALMGFVFLNGCSSMKVENYAHTQPKLDIFDYFSGHTEAWGQFQDRSGEVKRRFTVAITGSIKGKTLTLDERFVYDDGETQQRIWVIEDLGNGRYSGRADEVIGIAEGHAAGAVLNWRYTLDLPYQDSTIHVQFDDWMFLQDNNVMLNRAEVTKWGFRVGEVTLFFKKPSS